MGLSSLAKTYSKETVEKNWVRYYPKAANYNPDHSAMKANWQAPRC
jgi:hypothetical protein